MNSLQSASSSLRYSVRNSLSQVPRQQLRSARRASTEAGQESKINKITIPKRIERGPTDILKALSSTVKKDYTAPHYKYHDDPFLIPTSNMTKRVFALSQESGRKAAQWIQQEHADLFQHRVADPPIEAFFPAVKYDENSEVDESVLQKVIALHQVSDALTVYGLLEKNCVELSRTTKQSLLELLCYYNCQDALEEKWIEERWFAGGSKVRERKSNTWKNESAAEKLFQSLSPPDAASYSALLCGKAQFGNVSGAYKLYQEAADAGICLPAEAFDKLISGSNVLKEGHDLRWQFVEDMLSAMKQQGVAPDLGTLNAILETLSSMSTNKNSQKFALQIIAEFRDLGIEPSAASYYFLLNIFCQDRSSVRNGILVSILNILEGRSLGVRDPRDVLFFSQAMDVCRFHLTDVDVAYRVDKLLHTADNYNLIGDSYKESIYYRNFFILVCQMSPLNEFMELYNKLVPNVYVPEPGIMEEVIKAVDMNEAVELLPRLWSDLVMFEQADREPLLCAMLAALQRSHTEDNELVNQHADVAWAIWRKVEGQRDEKYQRNDRFNKKISWTGQMLGDIMEVVLRADRFDDALEVMTCLDKRQNEVLGVPNIATLTAFLQKAIERKDVKNAIWCIQYCYDAGFDDLAPLGQKLSSSLELDVSEQSLLVSIVGQGALQKQAAGSS